MRKLTLRHIRLTDLEYFLRWWRDPALIALTSGSLRIPTERWIARRVVEMINPSEDIHRIIMLGRRTIGHCALIRRRASFYEVQIMIGEKAYWNKGYGATALQKLCATGRRAGMKKIYLEVRPSNKRAIVAFTKCGFRPSGSHRRPSGGVIRTLRMDYLPSQV